MRQNKIIRIGITGGMGAGKSTVAEIFEREGLLVVDADMVSRDVLGLYEEVNDYIRKTFGEEYFQSDGTLNRRKFGLRIFSDEKALAEYEDVIMPFIIGEIKERFEYISDATEDSYAVLDAPLLFNVAEADIYDVAVTVEMPLEMQIERVMERDSLSRQEVLDRINRQMTRAEREILADYIIINDGSIDELEAKALNVLATIRGKGRDGQE